MRPINALRTIAGILVALTLLAGCGIPTTATSMPDATALPTAAPEPTTAPRATAVPEPTAAPELAPEPRSITYSTPYSEGLTFYENPSEGFAIVLPDKWLQVDMDKAALEARIKAVEEQRPMLASFVRETLHSLADTGMKFYAADLRHSPNSQGCTCAATVNIIRRDYGARVMLKVLVPQAIHEAQEFAGRNQTVAQQRLQLPAGEALELSYHVKQQSGSTAKDVIVTQYMLVNGRDIYTITFTTTPDLLADYVPVFEQIRNSFRFVERRV